MCPVPAAQEATPDAPLPFPAFVAARRPEIDRALEAWLPCPPACHESIADAIRYAVMSGGKRLRPLLTLASADAVFEATPGCAKEREQARGAVMAAACAAELIHTQSLVHDDLPAMDDDALRRGQPTVHVRFGEGVAILAGDALLVEAFGLLARGCGDETNSVAALRRLRTVCLFAEGIGLRGMAGGQAMDLAVTGTAWGRTSGSDRLPAIWDLHRRKTGCLFRAAAASGAVLAGACEPTIDALAHFAERIGIAFQIADDILDSEGASEVIGKTPGKDRRAGKPTFATLAGVHQARATAVDTVREAVVMLDAAGLATPVLCGLAWSAIAGVADRGRTGASAIDRL